VVVVMNPLYAADIVAPVSREFASLIMSGG
jgi:hypothetical protein